VVRKDQIGGAKFTADHPFTVSIDSADLTRGLRH